MRYWKFIVNAGVRYGEVLDEKIMELQYLNFLEILLKVSQLEAIKLVRYMKV